ncbi:chromosome segregation protein ParM [Serratia fonticola]
MTRHTEISTRTIPGSLSAIQKDVLFLLASIEARGNDQPVPVAKLLLMINRVRTEPVFATNFRASCHTLSARQLVREYRNERHHLALILTESGREQAAELVDARNHDGA